MVRDVDERRRQTGRVQSRPNNATKSSTSAFDLALRPSPRGKLVATIPLHEPRR